MDTRTGMILDEDKIPSEQLKHFVPVERDLTVKERFYAQIQLYAPCGCGSGKKFKFCCYRKSEETPNYPFCEIPSPIPNAKTYKFGECNVLVSQDELKERGIIRPRWHLSISHPQRYPSWDEIKKARYTLIAEEITMAMFLPPPSQFINVHKNCFHLYETDNIDE